MAFLNDARLPEMSLFILKFAITLPKLNWFIIYGLREGLSAFSKNNSGNFSGKKKVQ